MPIRKGIESGMNTSPSIKVAPTRSQKLAYRSSGGGGVHVPGSEGDDEASGRGGIGCPSIDAHRLRRLRWHCYDFRLPTGEWRNWQTRRIQVPVSLTGRGGSTPPSPTSSDLRDVGPEAMSTTAARYAW